MSLSDVAELYFATLHCCRRCFCTPRCLLYLCVYYRNVIPVESHQLHQILFHNKSLMQFSQLLIFTKRRVYRTQLYTPNSYFSKSALEMRLFADASGRDVVYFLCVYYSRNVIPVECHQVRTWCSLVLLIVTIAMHDFLILTSVSRRL
jgi:hypothetical protein